MELQEIFTSFSRAQNIEITLIPLALKCSSTAAFTSKLKSFFLV